MILIRAIKPGKPLQSSIFRDEVKREANDIRKDMLADFEKTTATWEHKPKFASKVDLVGGVRIQVATDDPVYGYVDEGTKPHVIRPRHKRALAFKERYRAKTKPKVIGSTRGGSSGNTVVRPEVHHPGTKARNFTKTIHKKYSTEFRRRVQNALDRAARRFQ